MAGLIQSLIKVARFTEIYLAFGVGLIIFMMIIPISSFFLDLFLAISISISLVILMTSILISTPMEMTSFPTILLISTMFRLSLNLASTKLILSQGHTGPEAAGSIIDSFARFLISGNLIIGVIVFCIIIIINFVVITKGASRIAEVSARFILDAIPGKQMAIDADLSAGIIDDREASKRRANVEQESNFYGAMDGASKFVRGDAIAGFIITIVNLIGGIAIGVLQKGMTISIALERYSLLTIGDGLVSQIPALIISVSAGLLISKISSKGSAELIIAREIATNPISLIASGIIMLAIAIMPGIPKIPFISIAIGLIYFYYVIDNNKTVSNAQDKIIDEKNRQVSLSENALEEVDITFDTLKIELGYNILGLIKGTQDPTTGQDSISKKITTLRRKFIDEFGIIIPSIRVIDNINLDSNEYCIKIKESTVAKGMIKPNMILALNPNGDDFMIQGEKVKDPAFNVDAIWIPYSKIDEAKEYNYTLIEPQSVLLTHLSEVISSNLYDIFSISDLKLIISKAGENIESIINDIVPSKISIYNIHQILTNLIYEGISIRDLQTIISTIAICSYEDMNLDQMTERVRHSLSRTIANKIRSDDGNIYAVSLSQEIEDKILNMDNNIANYAVFNEIINKLNDIIETQIESIIPCIVTNRKIRSIIKRAIAYKMSYIDVVSSTEISNTNNVVFIGNIE